jgi:hypothetical protein
MMCLIFEAELQHAKLIQEPTKCRQGCGVVPERGGGVLYEFVGKKQGIIMYRHREEPTSIRNKNNTIVMVQEEVKEGQ